MTLQPVCALADLAAGTPLAVTVDGVDLALVRVEDEVYAVADECTHAAIPLSEGEVEGCELECWLHGSRFDLRTGKPSGPPAIAPVATYPVVVEGDRVLVDLTPTDHGAGSG